MGAVVAKEDEINAALRQLREDSAMARGTWMLKKHQAVKLSEVESMRALHTRCGHCFEYSHHGSVSSPIVVVKSLANETWTSGGKVV